MNYGLPYKGSKNKLAERIANLLPQRKHLYDLFCGGCAVSHAALVKGKYEHIHINDFNWMSPALFMDALDGKYDNETRWISREDFFRLKDTDPYVAAVWSYGNNMRDYMYSREIEPLKRAIHYAIFFSDYEPGLALGYDLSFMDGINDVRQRYALIHRYLTQSGHFQQQPFDGGGKTRRTQNTEALQRLNIQLESWERTKRIREIGNGGTACKRPDRTAHRERTARMRATQEKITIQLKSGNRPGRLDQIATLGTAMHRETNQRGQKLPITSSVMDYSEVEIPEDSVIYCDIPYMNTNKYNGAEQFDYERFYDWACRQTEPVFISSYEMPDDSFECVMEFRHLCIYNNKSNNIVTERIFIPRGQTERGNLPPRQLSLFDDM